MGDHGLCDECCSLIEISEPLMRHKKNKYHARCFKCNACQTLLRGSMIERGADVFFCIQCASNNFQAKPRIETTPSSPDSRVVQTTTTASATNPLSGSRSPRGPTGAVSSEAALLASIAAEAKLKRAGSPAAPPAVVSKSPAPKTGAQILAQAAAAQAAAIAAAQSNPPAPSTSAPISVPTTSPPSSPQLTSHNPANSPAAPSPFTGAPPPPRSSSFRLQLSNAVATAAKVAAQRSGSPNTVAVGSPNTSSFASTTYNSTPATTTPTPASPSSLPVPPPFSSITSASTPNLYGSSPVPSAPLRNSNDRPLIGGAQLRMSGGGDAGSRGAIVGTPTSGGITVGAARPATRRVPGSAVAALPPPPSNPAATNNVTPRGPSSPRGGAIVATPPAPAANPLSDLDAEEERIRQEMAALDREEAIMQQKAKPLPPIVRSPRPMPATPTAPAEPPAAKSALPEVITSAWLGRELVPDKPLKLQRHPNARQAQRTAH